MRITVQHLQEITSQRFATIEQAIMTMAATVESFKPAIASIISKIEEQIVDESKHVPDSVTEQHLAELKPLPVPQPDQPRAPATSFDKAALTTLTTEVLREVYSAAGVELKRRANGDKHATSDVAAPAPKKAKQPAYQVVRNDGKKCGRRWPSMAEAQAWMNGWIGNMKGATYSIQTTH